MLLDNKNELTDRMNETPVQNEEVSTPRSALRLGKATFLTLATMAAVFNVNVGIDTYLARLEGKEVQTYMQNQAEMNDCSPLLRAMNNVLYTPGAAAGNALYDIVNEEGD